MHTCCTCASHANDWCLHEVLVWFDLCLALETAECKNNTPYKDHDEIVTPKVFGRRGRELESHLGSVRALVLAAGKGDWKSVPRT